MKSPAVKPPKNGLPTLYVRRTRGWILTLVVIVFVFLPSFFMWLFLSKDWNNQPFLSYGYTWLIAGGFLLYTTMITLFFVWVQVAWFDLLNFTLPIAICMMGILVTSPLSSWIRALIVIVLIASAFPINLFTGWLIEFNHSKQLRRKRKI